MQYNFFGCNLDFAVASKNKNISGSKQQTDHTPLAPFFSKPQRSGRKEKKRKEKEINTFG